MKDNIYPNTKKEEPPGEVNIAYQTVLDESSASITIIDAETYRVLYANKAALTATTNLKEKYVGSVCYENIHNFDKPCKDCILTKSEISKKAFREVEYKGHTYHQEYKLIEWNNSKALMEYTEDITEQKQQSEQTLKRNKELSDIINNIPSGIVVYEYYNNDFSVKAINPAMCRMLGVESKSVVDATLSRILLRVSPEDRDRIATGIMRTLTEPGKDIHFEFKGIVDKENKNVWFSAHAHSVIEETGRHFIYVSYNDITQKKKLDEVQTELIAAQKTEKAKSEFFSKMSHDMRTPMNSIINMVRFAREDLLSGGEVLADLDNLENASRYLLSLINDILDISKINDGKFELHPSIYSYDEFANYIYCMIKPLCDKKKIKFEWNKANVSKPLYIDKVRFNQMIFNLLSNSVKYTNEGGTVIFKENDIVKDDEGLTCSFCVEDTGIGISEEYQRQMFDPFSRANEESDAVGTGLGLSIVKSICEAMDAKISVESKVGEGTKFTVRLRLVYATPEQIAENKGKNVNSNEVDLSGHKVLVAEDHPLNMQITMRILSSKGIEVLCAENGQLAVEIFENSRQNEISAILMDMRMPAMNGLSATKEIRNSDHPNAKSIPIIAMTANAYEDDRQNAIGAGMTDFLTKPVEPELVYSTLKKYI